MSHRVWPSHPPVDCPFPPSSALTGIAFTGRHAEYTGADTWYPSWASDSHLYSPWTGGNFDWSIEAGFDVATLQCPSDARNANNSGSGLYFAPLRKYVMCGVDGWPTVDAMNTFILEADAITGPWRLVTFLERFGIQAYFANFPSKFISDDGCTAWLCYSANFTNTSFGTHYNHIFYSYPIEYTCM